MVALDFVSAVLFTINFQLMIFNFEYFRLSRVERLTADLFFYFLGIAGVLFGLLLISQPLNQLRVAGFLILIFFADSFTRIYFGEHRIDTKVLQQLENQREVEVNNFFDFKSYTILKTAFSRAALLNNEALPFFILRELFSEKIIRRIILKAGIDQNYFLEEINRRLEDAYQQPADTVKAISVDEPLQKLEELAIGSFLRTVELGEATVSLTGLFLGTIYLKDKKIIDFLSKLRVSASDFHNIIFSQRLSPFVSSKLVRKRSLAEGEVARPVRVNRAWTSHPTPYLDTLGNDLTAEASSGSIGFLVGHENEYRMMQNILARVDKNNVILVGEEGTGKTSIIEHLAFNMNRDNVPTNLFDKRLIELEITRVASGAMTSGEIQERFKRMIAEAVRSKSVVLVVPNIHNLALTTKKEELGGFEALEPILKESLIPVIGTTTPKLYRQIIEINPNFKDLFEAVKIEDLSQEQALKLLVFEALILEKELSVVASYPALKKIIEMASRYFHSRPLPSVAIDLLKESLAEVEQKGEKVLLPELVVDLVTRKTKIPVAQAKEAEAETLLNLEKKIHEKLINQKEAVELVSSAMRQYRTGLSREKGPIASFLFAGPTGVGKTELAKVLAGIYFGSEDNMIRFDMSEYQTLESVFNFIGSPDGEIVGSFVEKVKTSPFSLILLDEFEKANSKILDLFLPLLDEGMLTDNLGERIDFKNTIIIATSNAKSEFIKTEIEKGRQIHEFQDELKTRLTEVFKPELLNRFDGVVAFRQLNLEEIRQIAVLNLKKLSSQIKKAQNLELSFSDSAVDLVAKLGYDPVFGARPLRGVIAKEVKDKLAKEILAGRLQSEDKILVSEKDGILVFAKEVLT